MTAPSLRVVTTTRPAPGGAERLLDPSRAWTVGRGTDADVVIDDGLVSRRHLVLEPRGGGWTVHDVSSNGTWLRGNRIAGGFALPTAGSEQVHLGAPGGPTLTLANAPAVAPRVAAAPGPPPAQRSVPDAAPRRRRRRGLRWLVALVVLVVLLVVADRAAAAVAGTQAVKQIVQQSQGLTAQPSVSFRGFPFLTQVATGHYRDIHVRLDDVTPDDAPRIDSIEADLHGADVPLSSVLHNTLTSIPIDRVDGTVAVTFADLNAYLAKQTGGLVLSASGGAIHVSGKVGQGGTDVDISGSAKLGVADGGLVVTPVDVQVGGGADILGGLGTDIASLLPPVPVPLDGLPFGLRLTSVEVHGDGLEASAQASRLVLEVPQ